MFNNRGLDILKLYQNSLTVNLLFTFGTGTNVITYIENTKDTQATLSVRATSLPSTPIHHSMIESLDQSYMYELNVTTPIISNTFVPTTINNRIDIRDCTVTYPTNISSTYVRPTRIATTQSNYEYYSTDMYWWSLDNWKVNTWFKRAYLTRPSYVNPAYEAYLFTSEENRGSWQFGANSPSTTSPTVHPSTMFYVELFGNGNLN